MENTTIKILLNNKEIETTLRVISANYDLEQKVASEDGKCNEFGNHRDFITFDDYVQALVTGRIKCFDTELTFS